MSQETVEIVRAAYERTARGDLGWTDDAEDFELVTSRENPDGGTFRGDEARRWMKAWQESFEGLTAEVLELTDAGDKVLASIIQRGRVRGSNTEVEEQWSQVVTVQDGVIVRLETFREHAEALEAAGLGD